MTISSSEAFPARSPIPLIVHSTCLAPDLIALKELATARPRSLWQCTLIIALLIFFTFFYTSITFNPTETADNLRKYGGFVPGIRPGESTALYIQNISTKLTTIGALYLTLVCLMPEFLIANYPIPFYLGGASILIVVVVAIDTVTQIQTRLMSSQYEQLIKKTKFGK